VDKLNPNKTMRQRFEEQLLLNQIPIEKVVIPKKSRDELPPVLAGLQWIYKNKNLRDEIFELLESKMAGNKDMGRPGMDLWHILVLGVVRLALDCDYDRLEYLVHYDKLLRQIMGIEHFASEEFGSGFHHRTISDNTCHLDETVLAQINTLVVKHGMEKLKKKGEKNEIKTDSYVLESNVHFPTDLNLAWDAARKCIELLEGICLEVSVVGWRKSKNWKKQIKSLMRICGKISALGGRNQKLRLIEAAIEYSEKLKQLDAKVSETMEMLLDLEVPSFRLKQIFYFYEMLLKHIDLIERRILDGEKIPHCEKVFSLFEAHTEWINKGKSNPSVELGHRILVSTNQHGLIVDFKVMENTIDLEEVVGLADRLLNQYGYDGIQSISFDKGFSTKADRELLELYIPEVIMPKRGKRNKEEQVRESTKRFKTMRNRHNAIESNINCLEHHGLNRCPDKGLHGFKRYTALGVIAYNLHKIGDKVLDGNIEYKLPMAA
jgi:transposase, IS5 family